MAIIPAKNNMFLSKLKEAENLKKIHFEKHLNICIFADLKEQRIQVAWEMDYSENNVNFFPTMCCFW